MTWVKLDDGFPEHPKVLAAGVEASWFYVCGLAYCKRQLTDGLIPGAVLSRLSSCSRPVLLANKLVSVGLWEREGDNFRVHDYLQENDTAEQVKAKRAATKERVRRWREKRDAEAANGNAGNAGGNGVTESFGNAGCNAPPIPDTDTDTEITRNTRAPARPVFDLDAVYRAHPSRKGKAKGLDRLAVLIKTEAQFDAVLAAAKAYADECRTNGTEERFIAHFSTWVNQRRWEDEPQLPITAPPADPAPFIPPAIDPTIAAAIEADRIAHAGDR